MQYWKYLQKVEAIICDVIQGAFPRSWVEDTVSYNICAELQKQLSFETIDGLSRPLHVRWDAFKLRGKSETLYGDIAVIVNYQTWEGETIKGISFFEAKIKDKSKDMYPSYKKSQLINQTSNLKHSNVLLYSHTQITEFEDNLRFLPFLSGTRNKSYTAFTHALSVQTDTVLQVDKNDRSLHKFGLPLSQQLCRNLRGMDLDTNPDVVNRVIGWTNDNNGGVNYLLVASVSESEKPKDLQQLELNLQIYSSLDDNT